ncbi:MAG: class I SAM-dependent methyltransferase [Chloroflexota bacterium]
MPFRPTFSCLWCGAAWSTRGSDDLEGWAQLCPTCLGSAGENPFRRARLRAAIEERAAAAKGVTTGTVAAAPVRAAPPSAAPRSRAVTGQPDDPREGAVPRRAAFPDDWFLRRGDFERGAIHDAAWAAELDTATGWLDERLTGPRLAEIAAGVGFWTPLLATKGEVWAWEHDDGGLELARERLLAHRLRAHLHAGDPFSEPQPDAPFDSILGAFAAGRFRVPPLVGALRSWSAHLQPGGRLILVDLANDPAGGPPTAPWSYHGPDALARLLEEAGLTAVDARSTGRFFVLAAGTLQVSERG